jgi:ATPase subunit of ABC transporter with duplicated ATPase domains
MDRMASLLDELNDLQKRADRANVYSLQARIDKMMPTLGFDPERDSDRLVASFSGGWQMRMGLGKILLSEPDLLLLDEPTNHLDVETIQWLEGYLKSVDVPMVIVSHDREFLDQLCTKIVEVERGVATVYAGNYGDYKRQKATAVAAAMAAYERQQKEIERQTELILRLSGTGQAGRAEAAKKALEKIQSEEQLLEKPWMEKRRPFRFPEPPRSGRIVARCEGLCHGYSNRILFENFDMLVERGERLALIGPNGCGKSTFLRLLVGAERPLAGAAALGDHSVVVNYFEQNQAEALDLEKTVLSTLEQAAGEDMSAADIKSLLGKMGFKGDAQHRKVEFLSGGEKARLALAKFMVTPASLLLLDEPTNHLDIPSKEMLEEALVEFPGTVLAVSHDRYFLRKIATRVLEIADGEVDDYSGDYDYFLSKNEDEAARAAVAEEKASEVAKSQIVAKSKMSRAEKEKAKKEKAKAFNTQAATKAKQQQLKQNGAR